MNKLKVFTFSLLLFFTVALVPVFAEDNFTYYDFLSINDLQSYNSFILERSDNVGYLYYSSGSFSFPVRNSSFRNIVSTNDNVYRCDLDYSNGSISGLSSCILNPTGGLYIDVSDEGLYNFTFSNFDIYFDDVLAFLKTSLPIYPILQVGAVQTTVQTIPVLLMDLLTVILPVGLAILGLVLGVSLVKRLVRLFL